MILADKIILLRKKNGWSQEELAEKLNVSRQSISKWEGAQSVPAMDKILQMSDIFGVTTDFLLKDSMEHEEYTENQIHEDGSQPRQVSMEEANRFLEIKKNTAPSVALGVAMCIMAPTVLFLITNSYMSGLLSISEKSAVSASMTIFFLIIASAVVIFVKTGNRTQDYEYLRTEPIETEYGVTGMVKAKREAFKETHGKNNIIGITLCILSALPVIVTSLNTENDLYISIGLSTTLLMVAVGVYHMVLSGTIWSGYKMLLQEEEFTPEGKEKAKAFGSVAGIYWLLATAIYLFMSFYTNAWDRTWIIWPVAGVLFAAVSLIFNCKKTR